MAKRKAAPASKRARGARKKAAKRSALRQAQSRPEPRRRAAKRPTRKTAKRASAKRRRSAEKPVPTPPSSLNMNRRGSAARTGRAEMRNSLDKLRPMTGLSGGDVDVNLEQAYFTGDEAPGGDNPTPDQDVVEDIGKAIGVQYQDNEELGTTEKVTKRDKHRWELDPASAEDYKDRS
jgi:uncharacterized protein DUF6335